MAAIVNSARPVSQILPGEFDLFPSSSSSSSPSSSNLKQRPRGHYRPFSTLYTDSPYVELEHKQARLLKRASSLGGFKTMNLGLTFKPKKNSTPITPPASPTSQLGTPSQKVSNPLSLKQRLKTTQDVTKPPSSSARPISPVLSLKKKRSMMSLFSTGTGSGSDAAGSSSPTEPSVPSPLGTRPVLVPPESADGSPRPTSGKSVKFKDTEKVAPTQDRPFVRKSMWATRFNMKLHPYQAEVPYMQAYNPILLESDRYSDILLQRLGGGYPTFGEHRAMEPLKALDLGCGEGHWILFASSIWTRTQFTAFDLVDVTTPAFESMENVHFVQGNFIDFPLPFADCSFDYVRMANLVLCIPYNSWEKLLREVRRILTIGGRIEIIDDQVFFPYIPQPPKPKETSKASRRLNRMSAFDFDDFSEDGDLDGDTLHGYESGEDSTFNSEGTCVASFEDKPDKPEDEVAQLSASETVRPYSRWRSSLDPYKRPAITDPYLAQTDDAIWHQRVVASRELESTFEAMLTEYGLYPYPSTFILEFMQHVFGRHAGKTQSFRVQLAEWNSPIGPNYNNDIVAEDATEKTEKEKESGTWDINASFGHKKKQWMTKDWDKKKTKRKDGQSIFGSDTASERSSLESPLPESVKPKAAKQLGLMTPESVKPKAAKQLGLPIMTPTATTTTSPSKPVSIKSKKDKTLTPPLSASPIPISPTSSTSSSSTSVPSVSGSSTSGSQPPSPSPAKMTLPKAPNAKTAALLGMSYTQLVAATAKAISGQRRGFKPAGFVQSPGLVIDGHYVAVEPSELEMHACKYVHTLLGCRPALGQYMARFKDEDGTPWVSEDMFAYYLWEYEAFRRTRIGWPSHAPEKDEEDPHTSNGDNPFAPFPRYEGPIVDYQPDEATHIRTIRVFEAIKVAETPNPFSRLTSGYGSPKQH